MGRLKDMTGITCGRLLVINRANDMTNGRSGMVVAWNCRCVCGALVVVRGSCLRAGTTVSCGCAWTDWSYSDRKHGFGSKKTRSKEYNAWAAMKQRCQYKGNKEFKNYGGRGIRICQAWRKSFAQFLADMGPKPSPQHSLERIDVNGDYEPGNCIWATTAQQSRNRRNNRWITINGVSMILRDWAREKGIHVDTIRDRVRLGLSIEEAIVRPKSPGTRVDGKPHALPRPYKRKARSMATHTGETVRR